MKIKTYNKIKWWFCPFFCIWCFLQNLIGLGVFIYSKFRGHCKRTKTEEGIIYYEVDNKNPCYGISLGYWIFLKESYRGDKVTFRHEWGHEIQSLIFGPLYLFLIGIPSGCSNLFKTYENLSIYYNYPWERWADQLGGISHSSLSYNREIKA